MIDKFINDLIELPSDPSFLDRLLFGGKVALIGMAIVFAVLILLWIILELFGYISNKIINKSDKSKKSDVIVGDGVPDVPIKIEQNENEIIEAEENEEELIAVITAAVASVLDKPVSGFRVVSFKQRTGWKQI
ncbi:MAG: OadG family protein [Oscillospiraceae bacterium]|nr:OadG family protein [Oscillospiraceae bacterium]